MSLWEEGAPGILVISAGEESRWRWRHGDWHRYGLIVIPFTVAIRQRHLAIHRQVVTVVHEDVTQEAESGEMGLAATR